MDRKWLLGIGALVIVYGLFLLLGQLFNFNGWAFFFPVLLVALGVWLILRPGMLGSKGNVKTRLLGDIDYTGDWQVTPFEIWLAIGDIHLDFTRAHVPEGETTITIFGFINDIKLIVPEGVGIRVHCSAFISDFKKFGEKETVIFAPLDWFSDEYASCSQKVSIRTNQFISDVKVKRPVK